jgi:hypothetical protein
VRERSIQRKLVAVSTKSRRAPSTRKASRRRDGRRGDAKGAGHQPRRVQDDDWVGMDSMVVRQLDDIQDRCDNPEAGRGADYIPTGSSSSTSCSMAACARAVHRDRCAPGMGKSAIADTIGCTWR